MNDGKTLAILAEDKGERLDKVLAKRLPSTTRSQVKRMIESGRVKRNGKETTVHAFVNTGDTITIASHEEIIEALPHIDVLTETDDYVVINKPAGLLVHQASEKSHELTLVDWIKKTYPGIEAVGDPNRPGIMHRLDRDTSGVMVIAKTMPMFIHLKEQFQQRTVEKVYMALVHGRIRAEQGEINLPIGRSRRSGRMAARPLEANDEDRPAITRFDIIKRFRKAFCLVHAYPLTGRTHQIRAHFMAYGHPIVGDMLYTVKRQPMKIQLGRQFLHAELLAFTDLAGKTVRVQAPMPKELQDYLQTLV